MSTRAADSATRQEGRFSAAGGLQLFWVCWPSVLETERHTRGTVVLVHGLGEHCGAYARVLSRLLPAGLTVYGFDLRGHGHSPGRRGYIASWDDYRQDLRAFIHFVQGRISRAPLFLLGHSLGGIIVLDYAVRYPDGLRGVVAISPALGEVGISRTKRVLGQVLTRVWPTFSLATGLDTTAISREPEVVSAYQRDPLVHDRGTARLATEVMTTVRALHARAADLRVPLLIQHGDADRVAQIDGSRRFVSSAGVADKDLHVYPGGYHQLHNDLCAEEVTADLLRWLETHLPSAREE
jgi:acylglycerol lipase